MEHSELKSFPRVYWMVVVCTPLGSAISVLLSRVIPYVPWLVESAFLGAGFGIVIGFVLGCVWQMRDTERWKSTSKTVLIQFSVVPCILVAIILFHELPVALTHAAHIWRIRSLRPPAMAAINIYDRHGGRRIGKFSDISILSEFASACSDVPSYSPSRPPVTKRWYVVISGTEQVELDCQYTKEWNMVVGYIVRTTGNRTQAFGGFQSRALAAWFERHVAPLDP